MELVFKVRVMELVYSQAWKEEPLVSWQVEHQVWVEQGSLKALMAEMVAVQMGTG